MKVIVDNLGEYIKRKRNEIGLTIREVVSAIDISAGYLSRIENGSSNPSLETLSKLASVLGFKIEDVCSFNLQINEDNDVIDINDFLWAYPVSINGRNLSTKGKYRLIELLTYINEQPAITRIPQINKILTLIYNFKKANEEEQ